MKKDNALADKTTAFAIRIVKCCKYLQEDRKEYIMSNQILRSGTSIGANIHEGIYAQSRDDFVSKMSISLKEASETEYWLELLSESGYITSEQFESIYSDCRDIIRILMSITKTQRNK